LKIVRISVINISIMYIVKFNFATVLSYVTENLGLVVPTKLWGKAICMQLYVLWTSLW